MRLKQKNREAWHMWFAWYPITVKSEIIWLECVERHRYISMCTGDCYYEYRLPQYYAEKA